MTWWRLAVFVLVIISALIEIGYFVRETNCRAKRLAGLCVLVYFLVLYSAILWGTGSEYLFVRNGMLTGLGTIALVLLHIADIITDYRGGCHDKHS